MRIGLAIGLGASALGAVGAGVAIALAQHDDESAPTTPGSVTIQPGSGSLGTGPQPDPVVLDPQEIEHPEYLNAKTTWAGHDLRETSVKDFADNLFIRYDHNENGAIEIGDDVAGLQEDERVTGHEDAYYSLINTFKAADVDKDDKITRSELEDYVGRFDYMGGDHPMFDGSERDGKLGVAELKGFEMSEILDHSDQSMVYDLIGVQQKVTDGNGALHQNHAFSMDLPEYREWPDGTFH
jgi:hypothetical protein